MGDYKDLIQNIDDSSQQQLVIFGRKWITLVTAEHTPLCGGTDCVACAQFISQSFYHFGSCHPVSAAIANSFSLFLSAISCVMLLQPHGFSRTFYVLNTFERTYIGVSEWVDQLRSRQQSTFSSCCQNSPLLTSAEQKCRDRVWVQVEKSSFYCFARQEWGTVN